MVHLSNGKPKWLFKVRKLILKVIFLIYIAANSVTKRDLIICCFFLQGRLYQTEQFLLKASLMIKLKHLLLKCISITTGNCFISKIWCRIMLGQVNILCFFSLSYGETKSSITPSLNLTWRLYFSGSYYAAVIENQADFAGRVVVDVGAGSGILSLFAAQVLLLNYL